MQMTEIYSRLGVSPGRGSYDLAVEAAECVERTRRKLTDFFGASDPQRVVFTANATDALNLVIQGVLQPCRPSFLAFESIAARNCCRRVCALYSDSMNG